MTTPSPYLTAVESSAARRGVGPAAGGAGLRPQAAGRLSSQASMSRRRQPTARVPEVILGRQVWEFIAEECRNTFPGSSLVDLVN